MKGVKKTIMIDEMCKTLCSTTKKNHKYVFIFKFVNY